MWLSSNYQSKKAKGNGFCKTYVVRKMSTFPLYYQFTLQPYFNLCFLVFGQNLKKKIIDKNYIKSHYLEHGGANQVLIHEHTLPPSLSLLGHPITPTKQASLKSLPFNSDPEEYFFLQMPARIGKSNIKIFVEV